MRNDDSNLVYHIVLLSNCHRLGMGEVVESCMKEICSGIELRYDWITFLEVGSDGDGFHSLVKSNPRAQP